MKNDFLDFLEETDKVNAEIADILVPPQVDDDYLAKELKRDVLDEREKRGESRSDFSTLADFMFQNQIKETALKRTKDTYFGSSLAHHLEVFAELGFQKVYEESFLSFFENSKDKHEEKQFMFWQADKGILLVFDTFSKQTTMNSGHFYYNLINKPNHKPEYVTSSGSWSHLGNSHSEYPKYPDYDMSELEREAYSRQVEIWLEKHRENVVWAGDHDAREAIKFNIRQLEKNYIFLPKWKKKPWLWLLHHMDVKGPDGKQLEGEYMYRQRPKPEGLLTYDSDAINARKIAQLPDYVQEAINV